MAATFDLTLIGYWAVPTAPPWWASEKGGRLDGAVERVVVEALRELRGRPRPAPDHEQGANPWAAMPSDHTASAATAAVLLAESSPTAGAVGAAYAGLLAVALVYLGEHYVTDVLAGLALTALVQRTLGSGTERKGQGGSR